MIAPTCPSCGASLSGVYTYAEFCAVAGFGRDEFRRRLHLGLFDHLRAEAPRRFAKVKVDRWLAGELSTPRQFRRAG